RPIVHHSFPTRRSSDLFNAYRISGDEPAQKLNKAPLTGGTNFVDEYVPDGAVSYFVRPAMGGKEQEASKSYQLDKTKPFISVPEIGRHTSELHSRLELV